MVCVCVCVRERERERERERVSVSIHNLIQYGWYRDIAYVGVDPNMRCY